ncbi:hypothetical protein MRX96_000205 [Rhipicephalus microplus]
MADAISKPADHVKLPSPDDQESANNAEAATSKKAFIKAQTLIFPSSRKQASEDSLSEEKLETSTSRPRERDTRKRPAARHYRTPGNKDAVTKTKRVTVAAISKRTSVSTST